MADHERSTTVNASADAAFEWLSNPANMPSYTPMMRSAERTDRGLRVTADGAGGTTTVRDVRFVVDERARQFQWHPEGSDYHGQMSVDAEGGRSRVTIKVHVTPKADEAQAEQALDYVLGKIRQALDR
jgi:carbon monoxide dehydrogenase subunit G